MVKNGDFFNILLLQNTPSGETVVNIFALFFHSVARSIRWCRFCKKFSVYSQLKRVTDSQTD